MDELKTTYTIEELKVKYYSIKIYFIQIYCFSSNKIIAYILIAYYLIKIQKIFEQMDWDKNGEISKIEFKSYLAK